MQKFFCRILTFTFLFTSLIPTDLQAQTRRQTIGKKKNISTQLARRTAQAQQQNTPAQLFKQIDERIRAQHDQAFRKADNEGKTSAANTSSQKPVFDQAAIKEHVNPVYRDVPAEVYSKVHPQIKVSAFFQLRSDFLDKVRNNTITLEELIEVMDPMNPSADVNHAMLIAYAAEVLGNTADYAKMYPDLDTPQWREKLPEIEARLLYRLALLGFEAPSYTATANAGLPKFSTSRFALKEKYNPNTIYKIIAVGTLRMTLLKIHQYYQAKGKEDPVEAYQKAVVAKHLREESAPILQQTPSELNGWKPVVKKSPAQTEQEIQKQAEEAVNRFGNLADFAARFTSELRNAKSKNPEQGSKEYQQLQILAEYATAYAIENDPKQLKTIVEIFDEGVKRNLRGDVTPGDFHRDYSPILNAIFNTIFENTRYSIMGNAKTQQIVKLLAEFSNPEKYSLPTRVFALEAASLLFRPFHSETLKAAQQRTNVFAPLNFNKPDEKVRKLLAARAVELYCPLTNESTFGMKDYGLSASEMQALADQLAYIYDGFYDISTTSIHMPGQDPHQAPTQCVMSMKNKPNQAKKYEEISGDVFWFTVETAFWTFGGDVLMFLGTAFRLTRGAIIALPAAGKAVRLANWGEKAAAFNREIRDGAKYANWIYKNKKQQGYMVEYLVEKVPAKTTKEVRIIDGAAKEVETTVPRVAEWEKVTTTHQLQGKYSAWNPKRWWSDRTRYQDNIVGMRVTHTAPNFHITQGTMEFETPISGLNSLADISRTTRQLKLPNAERFWMEQKPYWTALQNTNQALVEQGYLQGLEASLGKTHDLWISLGKATGKGNPSVLSGAQTTVKSGTKWYNWQWGALKDMQLPPSTKIFVAPKKFSLSPKGSLGDLTFGDGIENIPQTLPGFYSTVGDLASGNIHRQAFRAFFKPMEWKNLLARTFLPDYVPTKLFWQASQENPLFSLQMLPKMIWRNRFINTTLFFGTWILGDKAAYIPFKYWLESEQTKDVNAELAKYGDAFDPVANKQTELMLQAMGEDLTDQRAMQTFEKVLQATPESDEGTLLNAPIIMGARYLGDLEFITPADKTNLANQAYKIILNRANTERMEKISEQQQSAVEAARQADVAKFTHAIMQQHDQLAQGYKDVFAQNPALKKQFDQLYQDYINNMSQVTDNAQIEALDKRFIEQRDALLKQAEAQIKSSMLHSAAQAAQEEIMDFKKFAGDLAVVTPDVEQKIRNAYATYAHKLLKVDATMSQKAQQAKIDQITKELSEELGKISNDFIKKNPKLYQKLLFQQLNSQTNE